MPITLREAGPADALMIAEHRDAMFRESGKPEDTVAGASARYRDWLAGALGTDEYLGWLADENSNVLGSIGLWLLPWPSHPSHPGLMMRGYISNMWVLPAHRRKGIGRQLVQAAIDGAKARGITYMVLHATEEGRKLYESMGWKPSNEMTLRL
jgi:ribosomal protein S18 acetylase RimI-like enzyme